MAGFFPQFAFPFPPINPLILPLKVLPLFNYVFLDYQRYSRHAP